MVARGDVWLINLDPTMGSEIRKSRPCVVVSPPELNDHLKTVIVAPMTSSGFATPFRVALTFQSKSGFVLLDQIRTIDKSRLVKKLGRIQPKTLNAILKNLQEIFE